MSFGKNAPTALTLLVIIFVFQGVGGLMGWITAQDIGTWYNGLTRSPLTPPNKVFGIAWTFLYLLLSISFFLIYRGDKTEHRKKTLLLFAAHMVLNWLWSPLFFSFHQLGGALALLILLVISGVMLALWCKKIHRLSGILFIPYIAWLCFATYLSYYIWHHN